jgi:transposase
MSKPDARKLPPSAQEDLRRRVVAAVRGGMSKAEAVRVFAVSRQSVRNWTNAAEEHACADCGRANADPRRDPGC